MVGEILELVRERITDGSVSVKHGDYGLFLQFSRKGKDGWENVNVQGTGDLAVAAKLVARCVEIAADERLLASLMEKARARVAERAKVPAKDAAATV